MQPFYRMAGEKRAYLGAYRDGLAGRPKRQSKWPLAYNKGYLEGRAVFEARAKADQKDAAT